MCLTRRRRLFLYNTRRHLVRVCCPVCVSVSHITSTTTELMKSRRTSHSSSCTTSIREKKKASQPVNTKSLLSFLLLSASGPFFNTTPRVTGGGGTSSRWSQLTTHSREYIHCTARRLYIKTILFLFFGSDLLLLRSFLWLIPLLLSKPIRFR